MYVSGFVLIQTGHCITLSFNRLIVQQKKVMRACGGLSESHLSSRRTFDRRLKTISFDVKERISTMGYLFICFRWHSQSSYSCNRQITLIKANKGHVWHKSSMDKGIVPRSGIDTDARWGFSHTKKGWLFGYKPNMISSTDSIVIPLSAADITTVNVQDNQIYQVLTSSSLPSTTLKKTHTI